MGGRDSANVRARRFVAAIGVALVVLQAGTAALAGPVRAATAIDHFVWTSNPIAPAGSLAAQKDVGFSVVAYDSANAKIVGGEIYVTYAGMFASRGTGVFAGHCDGQTPGNTVTLSAVPVRCVTDLSTGILRFNFYSGAVLPNGGTETFTAAADAAGALATSDSYTFAAIDHFVWTSNPIAPAGSLAAQKDVGFSVVAYDSANAKIVGGEIYVTYAGMFASRGTGVFAGHCDGQTPGNTVTLSAVPVRCVTDLSTGILELNFYSGAVLPNGGTETFTAAADAAGALATSDSYTFANVTTLTYDGATTGDFNDPVSLSATLIRDAGSVPIVGATIKFDLNGIETCTGTTDTSGRASCHVTPGEAAGAYAVGASFAGAGLDLADSTTSSFAVNLEDTALTMAGVSFIANGLSLTISATLTDPADAAEAEAATPIAGKTITFTLGSGATAQTCAGATNASGVASCTIANVNQPLGPVGIAARYVGDVYYTAASAAGRAVTFAYLARGSFIVGNLSATVDATVTWWGSSWSTANRLTGGVAPSAFKGFASTLSSSPPVAGGTWTTSAGASASPPSTVPTYMAVIVTNKVKKSGATILSGSDTRIAVVQVAPGYNPTVGSPGTGTLLGFLP